MKYISNTKFNHLHFSYFIPLQTGINRMLTDLFSDYDRYLTCLTIAGLFSVSWSVTALLMMALISGADVSMPALS